MREEDLYRATLICFKSVLILLFVLMVLLIIGSTAKADDIPKDLWKGLIAEAVSEGPEGMLAVACCVRNRIKAGLPMGLSGLKRKNLDTFVKKQGKKYENEAKNIVEKVFKEGVKDITNGATHYENVEAFGTPKWAKKMQIVKRVGCHTFFR